MKDALGIDIPCPFCAPRKGQDGPTFVLRPFNPVTPGHVLVIPKRHVESAVSDPDLTGLVMRHAAKIARDLNVQCNIITSVGEHATQTVRHLHVHIVPRREGDGLKLPWTGQR